MSQAGVGAQTKLPGALERQKYPGKCRSKEGLASHPHLSSPTNSPFHPFPPSPARAQHLSIQNRRSFVLSSSWSETGGSKRFDSVSPMRDRKFMGAKRVLRQSVRSCPRTRDTWLDHESHVACKDARLRWKFLDWLRRRQIRSAEESNCSTRGAARDSAGDQKSYLPVSSSATRWAS